MRRDIYSWLHRCLFYLSCRRRRRSRSKPNECFQVALCINNYSQQWLTGSAINESIHSLSLSSMTIKSRVSKSWNWNIEFKHFSPKNRILDIFCLLETLTNITYYRYRVLQNDYKVVRKLMSSTCILFLLLSNQTFWIQKLFWEIVLHRKMFSKIG